MRDRNGAVRFLHTHTHTHTHTHIAPSNTAFAIKRRAAFGVFLPSEKPVFAKRLGSFAHRSDSQKQQSLQVFQILEVACGMSAENRLGPCCKILIQTPHRATNSCTCSTA